MNALSAEVLREAAPGLTDFDKLGDDFVVFFQPLPAAGPTGVTSVSSATVSTPR